jgi:hypothetical protein
MGVRVLEAQIALPSAEQRHEDLAEVDAHLLERREEQLARRGVDLLDRLEQRRLRLGEVGALRHEEVVALHRLVVLLDGERIDRAELLELPPELRRFDAQGVVVEVHRRHFGDHLLQRSLPLRLEALANGRAAARELGEPELGVMQLVARRREPAVVLAHGMIRRGEGVVGRAHRRSDAARFASPSESVASRVSRSSVHEAICSASALSDSASSLSSSRSCASRCVAVETSWLRRRSRSTAICTRARVSA